MNDLHEFWRDEHGNPYLDALPLKNVLHYQLQAVRDEPLTLTLQVVVQEASGPQRLRHALHMAHQEAMEAIDAMEAMYEKEDE